jgi:hypothetical protein
MHHLRAESRYYRLKSDLAIDGKAIFPAGSCMPENWADAMRCPRELMVEIESAEGRAWFAADEERSRRVTRAPPLLPA